MFVPLARLIVLMILATVIGCTPKDPFNRQPLSGTVTIKGKPVKTGQIFFEPAAGQQLASNATITDGAFVMTRDQGLSPGNYHWKLLVLEGSLPVSSDGGDISGTVPAPKNIVPAKANGGTFEVKTGEETKLDIAIP